MVAGRINRKKSVARRRVTPRRAAPRQAARAQGPTQAMRTAQLSAPAARYLAALTHPFSKQAEGARVPEPYAINTVTRKVHQPIVVTSTAGGAFDMAVQPHLLASYVSFQGVLAGGAGAWSITNQPAGLTVRSAVTAAALSSLAINYRIVALGVRIKPNLDFTKAGGRIYGAVLPASVELPIAMDSGSTLAQAAACFDIPFDGTGIPTSIVNMPRGFQFTASELMSEGGAEVLFPICGAAATTFLEATVNQNEQRLSYNAAGGVATATALGAMAAAGFSQLLLRGEGLQPSADVFTVEVVYHVEGVPNVNLAGTTLVEAMPHNTAPRGPHEVHAVHAALTVMPVVDYVKKKMLDVSGKLATAARGRAMRGIEGAAERVLGLGMRSLGL